MSPETWMMDPKVRDEIAEDVLCRDLVDALHDAMRERGVSPAELAAHLGSEESEVRARLADPLGMPLNQAIRLLTPLGLSLAPKAD